MLCQEVQNYIDTAKGLPFFYVVGDENYNSVLDELKQSDITVVRMSDFCSSNDKFPDIDELVDYFRTSDIDYRKNKFVVVGLGEYLALRGENIAESELLRLKNTTLGNARAILLLRGISAQAVKIIDDDNKMKNQNRAYVSDDTNTDISITNMHADIGIISNTGMKSLLRALEDSSGGNQDASTTLNLDNSMFPITNLNSAYYVVKRLVKGFNIEQDFGTEEQWKDLSVDLKKYDKNIREVFVNNRVEERIYDDFYLTVSGLEYVNWLAFLYLKLNLDTIPHPYLKFVVEGTDNFEDFKTNVIEKIAEISHEEPNFRLLYDDRKRLLKEFAEEDMAAFVKSNGISSQESIYNLTNNTPLEKKTIIKWIAKNGLNNAISYIYPALNDYLWKYRFENTALADELTEYFDAYKKNKVLNRIPDDFMELVKRHASDISYAQLNTRDNAIKAIPNKESAFLYWIDALGVEYLSYITALAKKKGLSINIDIVRSDLPTITSLNKSFYEKWDSDRKNKDEDLDDIKHNEKGGYFFTKDEDPIHIPAELEVIDNAMKKATMELVTRKYKSFIIASDHGASRLAVIKKQELPHNTDTKGEHSGRCCKSYEGCDAPYKIDDNGFIALTDYGRFQGGRKANVEVHGGGSLEEIVVPVITLTLKKQANVKITIKDKDNITADRHKGVTLTLRISDVDNPDNVSLDVEDKRYKGTTDDGENYTFELKEIKRAKKNLYTADVFDGGDLISNISFKVKGKAATEKDEFDFEDEF